MYQKYFNRFEIKYQISIPKRNNIIKQIGPFMELDPYIKKGFNSYEVRSIYYDSPFVSSYFEKVNGIRNRIKLRFRYYPDFQKDKGELVFIELKKKYNENVAKSRVIVPFEKAFLILNDETPEAKDFYKNSSKQDRLSLREIWYQYKRYHLQPISVVCYYRQPYQDKLTKRFRITFDTNIKTRDYNFDLHIGGGSKYVVQPHMCVMEVKFTNFIPNWAIKIVQRNNIFQEKVSKFANGLEKMKIFSVI